MQITALPNDKIDLVWHRIKEFAEQAAKYTYGRFTANDIRYSVKTKPQQFWLAHKDEEVYGFVVTEISDYPQMRSLIMHFTAGKELLLWKNLMLEEIQNFAHINGCDVIESMGRAGWAKVFEQDGFEKRFMFYELPVKKV